MMEEAFSSDNPLWENKQHGYVQGKYSDDGPFAALLWSDLRAAYHEMGINDFQASMFEWNMMGVSNTQIAKMMAVSESDVRYHIGIVKRKLLQSKCLGRITVIVEECGGWNTVAAYLFDH